MKEETQICPQCNAPGSFIENDKLASVLKSSDLEQYDYFVCSDRECRVVYFSSDKQRMITLKHLMQVPKCNSCCGNNCCHQG